MVEGPRWRRRWTASRAMILLAALSLCAGSAVACRTQAAKTAQKAVILRSAKKLLLTVPMAKASKRFALMIQVGALPMKASLEVYDEKGSLLGTVSPFGAEEHRSGGQYTLPLPGNLYPGTKMTVLCVLRLDAEHGRAPKATELLHAEIVAQD